MRPGEVTAPLAEPPRHPRFFSVPSLVLIAPLCLVGAVIGIEMITTLGMTANTALIGALAAMGLARIPLLARWRSVHMQNLAQGAMSSASFGAGNALMLPIGIPFVMGRPDLVGPMLLGVFLAMLVDTWLMYRVFDSKVFPAEAAWPAGAATAEVITAGDAGGRSGVVLLAGLGVGVAGAFYTVPMAAFGVALIGDVAALAAFASGLLLRAYSGSLFGWAIPGGDLMRAYIPHGLMLGACLAALVQVAVACFAREASGPAEILRRALGAAGLAYLAVAVLLALGCGLYAAMSWGMLALFIAYAAFAAFLHAVIVGVAAMHVGWLPVFAVALITLAIGILMGFPTVALCVLVGYSAATGPVFADMGNDLKAGYVLRGRGVDPGFEREGRRQQLHAALFALLLAGAVAYATHDSYFAADRVAPVSRVYVAAMNAGASWDVARQLGLWAAAGALIQFAGGPARQLGVLLATGLLLLSPGAGWAVLAGLLLRLCFVRLTAAKRRADLAVFAAGTIAGDALYTFYASIERMLAARR